MREESCLVDYEIRPDSMTTQIGYAIAVLEKEKGTEEIIDILRHIQPLAYHVNGSRPRTAGYYGGRPCVAGRCI